MEDITSHEYWVKLARDCFESAFIALRNRYHGRYESDVEVRALWQVASELDWNEQSGLCPRKAQLRALLLPKYRDILRCPACRAC